MQAHNPLSNNILFGSAILLHSSPHVVHIFDIHQSIIPNGIALAHTIRGKKYNMPYALQIGADIVESTGVQVDVGHETQPGFRKLGISTLTV